MPEAAGAAPPNAAAQPALGKDTVIYIAATCKWLLQHRADACV